MLPVITSVPTFNNVPGGGEIYPIKNRAASLLGATLISAFCSGLFFGIWMAIMDRFAPDGKGTVAMVIAIGGLPVLLGVLSISLLRSTLWLSCRMGDRARILLAKKYEVSLEGALYVGFSPGQAIRNYGGDTSWDIGFLSFEPDRIRFFGDQISFDLPVDTIHELSIKSILGAKHIFATWIADGRPSERHFVVDSRQGRTMKELRKSNDELFTRLREWKAQGASRTEIHDFEAPPW